MTSALAPANLGHDIFGWDRSADGIVTVTMDDPDRPVNTLSDRFHRGLAAVVRRLHAAREDISGVVITSGKTGFCAGGDLDQLRRATPVDAPEMTDMVRRFQTATRSLERLGRPVVAAINGTALGAGLELALACTHRIAVDAPTQRLGLPEVTFGLLPGGGGVARTVRLLGLDRALSEVLLPGRAYRPSEALALGLVDELVTDPADLLPAAHRWILEHPDAVQPWDRPGFRIPGGEPADRRVAGTLPGLPARLRQQARGPLLPGVRNLVAAAVEGAQVDLDTALVVEARYCVELICGQVSTNLIRSRFVDQRAVERSTARPTGAPSHPASVAAIVGGGTLGAEIAQVLASAGIDVVLKDVTPEAAEQGRNAGARLLDADVAEQVSAYLAPVAVVASTTSTQTLSAAAEVIGLHFATQVPTMALVEIAVGDKTSKAMLARALDIVRQIGKTPILVNEGRGPFTGRVMARFLDEAVAMVGEGIPAASVEQAAAQAGYPDGPLALVDQLATDSHSCAHPTSVVMDRMVDELGRCGRAGGAGFYDYEHGRRVRLWPGLAEAFGPPRPDVSLVDLQERLLFAEALEAVRCLDEGVLRSVAHGNIGSLLGVGFPAWTGGALQYVNQYAGGPAGFVARAHALAERYGERFTPPASLVELSARGGELS